MRFLSLIALALAVTGSGCTLDQWRAYHECRAEKLAAKQEALEADVECCRSERLQQQEALTDRYEESLRSQLGLSLDQKLVLGQLQVDEEKLESLLKQRRKQQEALQKIYDEVEDERQEQMIEYVREAVTEALKDNNPEAAHQVIASCCNPKPECGCAAVEPITQYKPPEPIEQPLLPTEIPFLIPVSVQVQMENPAIISTHVERIRKREAIKKPCCPPCPPRCGDYETCAPQCTVYEPLDENRILGAEYNPAPPAYQDE
jgi:hypothetical protein